MDNLLKKFKESGCLESERKAALLLEKEINEKALETFDKYCDQLKFLFIFEFITFVKTYKHQIDNYLFIVPEIKYHYTELKQIENYLLHNLIDTRNKKGIRIYESIPFMYMRVAIGVSFLQNDIAYTGEIFFNLIQRRISLASPILFGAGLENKSMASCFVLKSGPNQNKWNLMKKVEKIANNNGGIGFELNEIQENDFNIVCQTLNCLNENAYGSNRKSNICLSMTVWNSNILNLLRNRQNRKVDLFISVFVEDLFMQRVENNEKWSLFSDPEILKKLNYSYGSKFKTLYESFEKDDSVVKIKISARKIFYDILNTSTTGSPWIIFKDSANEKCHLVNDESNHLIFSSNLCSEIMQPTSYDETSVCVLGTIVLPKFLQQENNVIDYIELKKATTLLTKILNSCIDVMIEFNNLTRCSATHLDRYRPIGIGQQGFVSLLQKMRISLMNDDGTSNETGLKIAEKIQRTIYFSALETSNVLIRNYGCHFHFHESEMKKGIFHPHYFGLVDFDENEIEIMNKVKTEGLANAFLVCNPPTASTSVLMGNSPSIDPFKSNVTMVKMKNGFELCLNWEFVNYLKNRNLWNERNFKELLSNKGSVFGLNWLDEWEQMLFANAFEIKGKVLNEYSDKRNPFIDQASSYNIFCNSTNGIIDFAKLYSQIMDCWSRGFKSIYYVVSKENGREPINLNNEETIECNVCSA